MATDARVPPIPISLSLSLSLSRARVNTQSQGSSVRSERSFESAKVCLDANRDLVEVIDAMQELT